MADGTRTIWTAPDLGTRLCCKVWEDGGPPTYAAQVWDGYWRWAESEEELRRALVAVARYLDQQAREKEGRPR